jgi:phage-related tail fiber protein
MSTKITARQISNDLDDANIKAAAGIQSSKLADGANFIKKDGSVAFTADQPMGGHKITGLAAGVAATDGVNKQQLDSLLNGMDVKKSVRLASTSNLILAGSTNVDGVAVADGDRVLAKNQTVGYLNGIYVVNTGGVWSRSDDADETGKVTAGMAVWVTEGDTQADTGWVLVTDDNITLGTTNLTFTQWTGLGTLVAGAGLTKTGNTVDVGAGAGIVVNANDVAILCNGEQGLTVVGGELAINPDPDGGLEYDEAGLRLKYSLRAWKEPCKVATTGNITLSGTQTIDGIAVAADDRVLVKNQSNNLQNGIYVVSAGSWSRADDADTSALLRNGSLVYIASGSTNANRFYFLTTANPVVIGSSAIVWQQLASSSSSNQVDRETPSGTQNGSNAAFTLANTPVAGSEHVYFNGQLQDAGSGNDYTISGNTITFESGRIPISTDKIRVSYRY